MSTYSEAVALQASLPKTGTLSWEIGKVYNALLAAAKETNTGSIALGALEPLERSAVGNHIASVNAESLRAMLGVIVDALDEGPSIG